MSEDTHSDRAGYASAEYRPSSPSGHGDVDTARHAAEALFAPKQPIANDTASAQQHARKPRILSAVTAMQVVTQASDAEASKGPLQHKTGRPRERVPASQLARVRTLLKYGMTIHQA